MEPSLRPCPLARKGALLEQCLPNQLEDNPDLRLAEHCESFEEDLGVEVSTATMSRRISRLPGGWPLKQSPLATERDEGLRGLWRWLASRLDAKRLVFVDESGFHTSMRRLRARAPRGKRAYGKAPRNRGKNQTLIASIILEGGMGEAISIKDAEVFETYDVGDFLAPRLKAGQVLMLAALGAHRTARVRELIEGEKPSFCSYRPTHRSSTR